MKVRFLKNHPAYGYFPGMEGDIADPKALLEGHYVEPVETVPQPAPSPKALTAPKPKKK